MSKTVAKAAAEYRARRAARFGKLEQAHRDILVALEGRTGATTEKVRAISQEALA